MGLDVLNEEQLHRVVVTPAIDKINAETIPALQKALAVEFAQATEEMEAVVNQAVDGLGKQIAAALSGVSALIESLDGWSVKIGPITIPEFPIRLSKPKEETAK